MCACVRACVRAHVCVYLYIHITTVCFYLIVSPSSMSQVLCISLVYIFLAFFNLTCRYIQSYNTQYNYMLRMYHFVIYNSPSSLDI